MLDFFAVITKGGLVLWYFQDVAQHLKTSIDAINALIKNVVLQVWKINWWWWRETYLRYFNVADVLYLSFVVMPIGYWLYLVIYLLL